MKNLLLDTNIVIYALNGDPHTMTMLERLAEAKFHISVISWIETLAGSFRHGQAIDEISWQLGNFQKIPLNDIVGLTAAAIIQERLKGGKKKKFQDSIIAATAITCKMPLLTNNPRDFRGIKGLKIISPKK